MTPHDDYPDWSGQTVAIIASGASLTSQQCKAVSHLTAIAVCSSWEVARFAAVIYAGDEKWWKNYGADIDIDAQRWTCTENTALHYGLNRHGNFRGVTNSGARALEFAVECNPSRVLLLGIDCHVRNGTHHHGDHKKTKNPDAARCRMWHKHFAAIDCKGVEVINCSPDSDLECFTQQDLSEALHG